jgi:hypothetical protein
MVQQQRQQVQQQQQKELEGLLCASLVVSDAQPAASRAAFILAAALQWSFRENYM